MIDYILFPDLKRCGFSCLSLAKAPCNLGITNCSISSIRFRESSLIGKSRSLKGEMKLLDFGGRIKKQIKKT